jgi:hypothetical protein
MSLLNDYKSDPVPTWQKISAQPMRVIVAQGLVDEVQDVSKEIVERALRNCRVIVERMSSDGYVFALPDRVLAPPPEDVDEKLSKFQEIVYQCESEGHKGKPLSPLLKSWYRTIGSVDFTGNHPAWPAPIISAKKEAFRAEVFLTDALVVNELEELESDLKERLADRETWSVGFSPDIFHKSDISGGPMYTFDLLGTKVDPYCFELESFFVPYLRDVFKWAGFPGFQHYKNPPKKLIKSIVDDLLPI